MFGAILRKVFGSKNDRELKRLSLFLQEINDLEPVMTAASDDELKAKTIETIVKAAKTGKIGDGKVFVSTIDEAWRIRTDERGESAV